MVNWAETYWTGSESQKLLETTLKNQTDIAKVIYADWAMQARNGYIGKSRLWIT